MSKIITDGFDLKVKLSESIISDLLQRVTPRAPLVHNVEWDGQTREMRIFFHKLALWPPVLGKHPKFANMSHNALPHLRFLPPIGDENRFELHFPFRAVIESLGLEKPAEVRVRLPAEPEQFVNEESGTTRATIRVHLSDLNSDQFNFVPESAVHEWLGLGKVIWSARSHFPQKLFEGAVQTAVIDWIRSIDDIDLTPKTENLRFFTFRPYIHSPDVSHSADRTMRDRFLGVYANRFIETETIPDVPNQWTTVPLAAGSHDGNQFLTYVPKALVQPILNEAAEEGAANSPEPVHDFKLTLHTGFVRATGNTMDTDFTIDMGLSVNDTNEIVSKVLYMDVDLPWYIDLLQVLPLGKLIVDAIRAAVSKATKSQGAQIGLSDFNMFSEELTSIQGAEVINLVLQTSHVGDITISTHGIVMQGQAAVIPNLNELELPPRVWGHRISKEFHSDSCEHRFKMAPGNAVTFANAGDALRSGFNGCAYCFSEYNINDLDYGFLHLDVTAHNESGHYAQVSFQLKRESEIELAGVKVCPHFNFSKSGTVQQNGQASVKAPVDLFTGVWQLTITRGSWSTQCSIIVPKRSTGNYVRVSVSVGDESCDVSSERIPENAKLAVGKLHV